MMLLTMGNTRTEGRLSSDATCRPATRAVRMLLPGLLLATLLSACDGGLFGTGDPDVELNAEGSAGITTGTGNGVGSDLTDGTTGDAGSSDGGTTDSGDGTGDGTQVPAGSDTDTTGDSGGGTSGTDDSDGQAAAPLTLDLGNYTDLGIGDVPRLRVVFTDERHEEGGRRLVVGGLPEAGDGSAVNGQLALARGEVAVAALLTGDNRLAVSIADSDVSLESPVAGGEPVADLIINAVRGSISTLVVATSGADGATGAMLLPNGAPGGDNGIARVRLIQLSPLGDGSATGSWRLQSAGVNPGGAEALFENVGWMRLPRNYLDLPAGDYMLEDTNARIASQALSLQGGAVYTLMVVSDADEPLQILRDDRLTSQHQ